MTAEEKNLLQTLERVFSTKEDLRLVEERLAGKMDVVLTSNDKVVKELKDLRQEVTMFTGGQMRQDEHLAKHDQRLGYIEAKVGI